MRRAASLAVAVLLMGSPAGAGAQGGDQELTLRHGGTVRSYLLHVPAAAARAPALVLVFHGGFGTGRSMVVLTGFNALADRHGFLVAYPDGTDRHWADGRETTPPDRQGVDDVGFVSALVDHLIQAKGVDPRRVFATGISNGGIFSHRLGCSLAGKIAAIGPIAGTMAEPLVPRCQPRQAVSVIAFHGTEDSFVPWAGGEVRGPIRGRVLSVASTTARWAALKPLSCCASAGGRAGARSHRRHAGAARNVRAVPERDCGGALCHRGRRPHLARKAGRTSGGLGEGQQGGQRDGSPLAVLRGSSPALRNERGTGRARSEGGGAADPGLRVCAGR